MTYSDYIYRKTYVMNFHYFDYYPPNETGHEWGGLLTPQLGFRPIASVGGGGVVEDYVASLYTEDNTLVVQLGNGLVKRYDIITKNNVTYDSSTRILTVDEESIVLAGGSSVVVDEASNLIKVTQGDTTYIVPTVKLEKPATPTLSSTTTLVGETTVSVSVSCATTGVVLYYTTNGTAPTTASSKTNGTISLAIDKSNTSKNYTVQVMAVKNGLSSDIVSKTYTTKRQLAAPTFGTPSGDQYDSSRTLTISGPSGATVKYRLGSSSTWLTYSSAITISSTTTVHAKVEQTNWESSSVQDLTVTVGALKMYYKALESKPTTVAGIEAMNSLKATSFPQDITFSEDGYNYGCFAYDKNLGELVTIWEYASNANMLDPTNPNWEKVGTIGNYNLYASKQQAGFKDAKFGMRK